MDLVYLLITAALFGAVAGLAWGCEHLAPMNRGRA